MLIFVYICCLFLVSYSFLCLFISFYIISLSFLKGHFKLTSSRQNVNEVYFTLLRRIAQRKSKQAESAAKKSKKCMLL